LVAVSARRVSSGKIDVDIIAGKFVDTKFPFGVSFIAGDVFNSNIAERSDAAWDDAVDVFNGSESFGVDVVEFGGVLFWVVLLGSVIAAHHAFNLGEHSGGGDFDIAVAASGGDLFIYKRVDAGINGGVEDDGETADENREDGEKGADFVAEQVAIGSLDNVDQFHLAPPF